MTLALPVISDQMSPPSAPAQRGESSELVDSHGRVIRDLRVSVTDRCNFRCVYCLDPDARFMSKQEVLTAGQMLQVVEAAVELGVRKVRVTGGEPTLHPELGKIVAGIAELGVNDIALTTNGSLLDEHMANALKSAGLTRVTVSLDTLREDRSRKITRVEAAPERAIEAVRCAQRAGLGPNKMNCVVVRGVNEDEVGDLAELGRELGVEVRFIEFMPLDSGKRWDRGQVVSADEILGAIGQRFPLAPVGREDAHATAQRYRFTDGAPGSVGVIASVTRAFCGACSRLRLTADGKIRPCLFSAREWDIRPALRAGAGREEIRKFLIDATWTKQAGHGIGDATFTPPDRHMAAIGG